MLQLGQGWIACSRHPRCAHCVPVAREGKPPSRLAFLGRAQVDGEVVSLVVPCADMANHQNAPNAAYAFSTQRDCFELTALRVSARFLWGTACLAVRLLGRLAGWLAAGVLSRAG